jgi:hypothetical protein
MWIKEGLDTNRCSLVVQPFLALVCTCAMGSESEVPPGSSQLACEICVWGSYLHMKHPCSFGSLPDTTVAVLEQASQQQLAPCQSDICVTSCSMNSKLAALHAHAKGHISSTTHDQLTEVPPVAACAPAPEHQILSFLLPKQPRLSRQACAPGA